MWFNHQSRMAVGILVCVVLLGFLCSSIECSGRRNSLSKRRQVRGRSRSSSRNKVPAQAQKAPASSNSKVSVYQCPEEAVQINCLSCRTKVYRKCSVPEASQITKVSVMTEYESSKGSCHVGGNENFGIADTSNIWVNFGCRARFLVCYAKGKHEPKTVNCLCTTSKNRCPMGVSGFNIHVQVSMLWSFGSGKCKEGESWGYTNNDIWVDKGCSATFRIVW